MATLKARLDALEQRTARATHKTALVLLLTCEPTPDQQAELDEAKRTHRPILIIRGQLVDFGQSSEITPAKDEERSGVFTYDKVPMREWR
jgi:hypothetical protein